MSSIMRRLRYVANQNPTLGPVITSLSELIYVKSCSKLEEVRAKQKKLSEIVDMIHAAHVFHRCVREKTPDKILHQESIMSLLFGDYLLAQSSVDMADLRYPKTVGLIAKGLEDYTNGEFLKISLFDERDGRLGLQELHSGINHYAELTCGSLLSNACLSAVLLAGSDDQIGRLASSFGLHFGAAHRLLELFHTPDTNSEGDKHFIETHLCLKDFESPILSHIDKSIDILLKLPDGDGRQGLMKLLEKMKSRSVMQQPVS